MKYGHLVHAGATAQAVVRRYRQSLAERASDAVEQAIHDFYAEVETTNWPNARKQFLQAMADIEAEWRLAADQGPGYDPVLTRRATPDYTKDGFRHDLTDVSKDEWTGTVAVLDEEAARISETEIGPWDMKPGLLAGPNVRISKKGVLYNTVLMRHQTPGTVGKHGRAMPEEIYEHAKTMEPWITRGVSSRTTGAAYVRKAGRLLGMPRRLNTTIQSGETLQPHGITKDNQVRIPWENPPEALITIGEHVFVDRTGMSRRYEHTASIYAGMRRMSQVYEKAQQQRYTTFRRVSANSDPDSWWHSGLKRNPITEVVAKRAAEIVRLALQRGLMTDLGQMMERAAEA